MEYSALPVAWHDRVLHLLYYSNDQDGVVLDAPGKLLWSPSAEELERQANNRKVKLHDPQPLWDLGALDVWLKSRSTKLPEAAWLYRCWNLLGDIATSLERAEGYLGYDERYSSIHEELFWGCNLPGFSQSAELFQVDLSQSEIKSLKQILKSGLEIFTAGCGI